MKLFIGLLLATCVSLNTTAQSTLSGTVTNQDGTPILATVYLPALENGAATDLDGNYSITQIPNGTYNVIYSSLGYATQSVRLAFQDDQSIIHKVILLESAVEMEEVILSTPFHKLQSDNVMKVERITTESLTTGGAINLSQGISNIAGVSTISTGTGIGKPVIRGLSSNRVLTYAQGVRLENQQFGDEHGLGISAAGVESVEVIKGPASLLYGSDALGGVLYINPELFADSGEFTADAATSYFSNTRGTMSTLGLKSSGEKFKFLLRAAYSSHADYQTGETMRVTNSRYNDYDIKSGLRFQNSIWKTTLRYNYNRSNIGIPEEIGEQTTSRDLLLPFQEIDNHILSWANTIFLRNSSLDMKLGYTFNDRREFEDSPNEAALRLKLNTFSYDLKYNLPDLGKFETIVGVQGMFQKNKNFGEEILIPNAEKVDFGIFATSHYHLEKVDLQGGLRLDTRSITTEVARDPMEFNFIPSLDRNFTSFNAALGAKVDITNNLLARLNLASGFRAPNLAELTSNGVHEGTNRYEIGNAELDSEQNIQTDLSLEFRNEHFEIFANGFYNTVNNYIFLTPTGEVLEDNFVFNYVQNDAALYGGEFGFHIHPHPLDWLHLESSFETVVGELKNGGDLSLIPANNLRSTLHFDLKEGQLLKENSAFLTLQNTFDQNRVSDFETTSQGYNLLSVGVKTLLDWDKISCQIVFNVNNLTNETYVPHLSRLKVDDIAGIGRNYSVRLKIDLP